MNRLPLILELYRKQRSKAHGERSSRRMSFWLAVSAWGIATRTVWVQRLIYFWLPVWLKVAPSDIPGNRK